ncbi:MAG: hypothetical protein HY765_10945 [Rhodomicrobium sp.]|jgi:hypothetical protein|nr:hypothetical protein [Rhodomicrobium sp.]
MGRHYKLKEAALACGIALSLAQQTTGAMAFSTEPVAPAQENAQVTPVSPFGQPLSLPGQTPPPANLADPLAQAGKPAGTAITIPGIGPVGTLPKLDFGLELLYGPKSTPEALQFDQHTPEGDVQIKGMLTHKF